MELYNHAPTPTNLEVTFNSTTSSEVSWTAGASATAWTYESGPTGLYPRRWHLLQLQDQIILITCWWHYQVLIGYLCS